MGTVRNGAAKEKRSDRDGTWKDAIARFLPQLLQRILPDLYEDADLTKTPKFLSQELRGILQEAAGEKRRMPHFVDELIDIPLKNGESRWVLLHIEVQGPGGEDISYRMMNYCCLIFAHHLRVPVGLAILTSPRPRETLGRYEAQGYGTHLFYHYNCFEVYNQDDNLLLSSDNPFDLMIYAAKKEARLRGKDKEEQKFMVLRELTRLLAEKGWNEKDRRDILILVARLVNLKDQGLRERYVAEVKAMKGERGMAAETFIEKYFRDEGREEGMAQGMTQAAVRMLRAGKLALKEIAEYSGLTLKEVKAIQRGMA